MAILDGNSICLLKSSFKKIKSWDAMHLFPTFEIQNLRIVPLNSFRLLETVCFYKEHCQTKLVLPVIVSESLFNSTITSSAVAVDI